MATPRTPTNTIRFFVTAVIFSLIFTAISVRVHRVSPEMSTYGNLCGQTNNEPCYKPTLKGGFPFAYIYDAPGISVEHHLSFEDNFSIFWFFADWLVYLALIALIKKAATDRSL